MSVEKIRLKLIHKQGPATFIHVPPEKGQGSLIIQIGEQFYLFMCAAGGNTLVYNECNSPVFIGEHEFQIPN